MQRLGAACLSLSTAKQTELTTLAGQPGLTGIILEDTAAPGYEQAGELNGSTAGSSLPRLIQSAAAATSMGYTEQNRLNFLRASGMDPVDLAAPELLSIVSAVLPFFPAAPDTQRKWEAFRYRQDSAVMARLFTSIKKANAPLKLLLGERSGDERWFGSWDKPGTLPVCGLNDLSSMWPPQARAYSALTYLRISVNSENNESSRTALGQAVKASLPPGKAASCWNGILLDATPLSVDKALEALSYVSASSRTVPLKSRIVPLK